MTDEGRQSVLDIVLDAIASVAPDVDPTTVDPAEDVWYALDLDSMDQLGVMIAIGRRTGIEIPEADYPQLESIDDMVAYLTKAGATG